MAPSNPPSYLTEFFDTLEDGSTKKMKVLKPRQSGKSIINEIYNYQQHIMHSNRVICQGIDGELSVVKDRTASFIGNLSNTEAIEVLSAMMVDHVFKNNMKLFNESKKEEVFDSVLKLVKQEFGL